MVIEQKLSVSELERPGRSKANQRHPCAEWRGSIDREAGVARAGVKTWERMSPGTTSLESHHPHPSGCLPTKPTSASSLSERLGSMVSPLLLS